LRLAGILPVFPGAELSLGGLADLPVLTELAAEIAADGGDGEAPAARLEVIERLLLDRVRLAAQTLS
jgi:hypothetical protein